MSLSQAARRRLGRWARSGRVRAYIVGVCLLILVTMVGCAHYEAHQIVVTAYSSDPISTNWRRGRFFFWRAYVASGPSKGQRKRVGITSSGTRARRGTIAADIRYYPYGTVIWIPGYGKGVVEDTGGMIQGPNRLDVYFSTRTQALRWGRQKLTVEIKR